MTENVNDEVDLKAENSDDKIDEISVYEPEEVEEEVEGEEDDYENVDNEEFYCLTHLRIWLIL